MEFQNHIAAIQMRMQEIQSKFGSGQVNSPSANAGGFNPVSFQQPGGMSGVTFEKLLASKMNDAGENAPSSNVMNQALSSRASDYDGVIHEASQKYGVDEKFIKSIIQQESGFNPNAKSWVGAMGLMQLMPETAKDLGVKNGYDPRDNVMAGVKYIKEQLDRFGGDKRKALAAYNAGPGAVLKYGDIPPFEETQNYVKNIMSMYQSMGGS
jgi:soluble lytic murein transglycosylase-like protein